MGFKATVPYLLMGLVACLILMGIAWCLAKTTVYTITNKRVAMRIGAALTVTLNVPFTMLASADLTKRRDGTGSIVMDLLGDTRLSYLICWPHVRPWKMAPTQPALRCLPDVSKVAQILSEAAEKRIQERSETVEVRAAAMPAE